MSTITVSDLKRKSAKQWRSAAKTENMVVTSQGQPVAVLLPIDAESLEPTLTALRSVRAVQAQAALQETTRRNGTDELTLEEIDAEIAAARQDRRTLVQPTEKTAPPTHSETQRRCGRRA